MNIVEPILFQCKLNPLTTAICVPGSKIDSVRYGMLEAFIHNVARTALKCGIVPGNIVATHINDTILHTAVVLGLMHAGATTLSLRGAKPVAGISPDVILTDIPGNFPGAANVLAVDQSWLEGDGAAAAVVPRGSDNDICRIILTSGSTGVVEGRCIFSPHTRGADRALHIFKGTTICPLFAILLRSRDCHVPRIPLRDVAF